MALANGGDAVAKPVIRVLAFDPGIGEMGWALLHYQTATGKVHVAKHGTLVGAKLIKDKKEQWAKFSKSFVTLDAYYCTAVEMLREYEPDEVVVEGAFYHKFAQTFASLTLVIHTLRRACRDVLGKNLHEVAPQETKKTVSGYATADKAKMREAVLTHPDLVIKDSKQYPIAEASEHAIDAIAHGTTFILKTLLTMLVAEAAQVVAAVAAAQAVATPVLWWVVPPHGTASQTR